MEGRPRSVFNSFISWLSPRKPGSVVEESPLKTEGNVLAGAVSAKPTSSMVWPTRGALACWARVAWVDRNKVNTPIAQRSPARR